MDAEILTQKSAQSTRSAPRFRVGLARSAEAVEGAQRLRYQVFADELGVALPAGAQRRAGLDADRFDRLCEHLVVQDEATGEIVGTYRILTPEVAAAHGGYYAESEFDLARFAPFRESLVEVGRSCVHPDYRRGAVIALLWSGLVDYMQSGGYGYLMGCASMPMSDGGHTAVANFAALAADHLSPPEWRVTPHVPLPLDSIAAAAAVKLPPLVKGYLRAGAYVCGAPAWDAGFNTADLLILLPMSRIERRYSRHFVGR